MSGWVDEQFINRVGVRIDRFERIRPTLYICRCPICGDSKQRKDIRRGYFINRDSSWRYYCHNCSVNLRIYNFLKIVDPMLCDEYSLEIYKEKKLFNSFLNPTQVKKELADEIPKSRLPTIRENPPDLVSFKDLPETHPAVGYLEKRRIPKNLYSRLFFAPQYRKWNCRITGQKYRTDYPDIPRLVIPYYWFDGTIFRYTARAFGNESPRYHQTVIDETKPRIFGLERVKDDSTVYVMEGQIDSLFLPNSVAVGSANYGVELLNTFPDKVFVPDNQPRNADVVAQVGKLVSAGNKVVIWQEQYGKDINKMVMDHGFSVEDLTEIIRSSTYQGVEAQLRFGKWKKC